jgi:chitinase
MTPSAAPFPTPYAGTYYPLYGAWTEPTAQMRFDLVSTLFIAFAHAYPVGSKNDGTTGATLQLEQGQPNQETRLLTLVRVARKVNPNIKIMLSLGWNLNDWTYISGDCTLAQPMFPASVVALVNKYGLDGFDIDDENIGPGGTSGNISPVDFATVVSRIRTLLRENQYLSITPADNGPPYMPITTQNMNSFNLINCQNYGSYGAQQIPAGYPGLVAYGLLAGNPFGSLPAGYRGAFNWTLPDDAAYGYSTTRSIAAAVGYPPKPGS